MTTAKSGTAQLIAGVVCLVVLVAAYVVLAVYKLDTTTLLGFGSPVVLALLVTGHFSNVTDAQNQTIAKIDKQTNGVMDARIQDGVSKVLRDAGILPADPVAADPVEPASDGS